MLKVRLSELVPTLTEPFFHWQPRVPPPVVATTLKVTVVPEVTVCEIGWVVIVGGTTTVRVALTLVTLPALLVTTTV